MQKIYEIDKKYILEALDNFQEAEIYHHPYWQDILGEVFGFKSMYLASQDALLPLMYSTSPFFKKNKIVSLPIVTYGGLIGNKEKIEDFLNYLKEKKFKKVIIKEFSIQLFDVLNMTTPHAEYRLLLDSKESVWKGLNKGKKSDVNSAKKLGYNIIIKKGKDVDIEIFFILYLKKMKDFGTPPLPKKFFTKLLLYFKNDFMLYEIYRDKVLIGCTICIGFKDIYYYIYAAFDIALTKEHKFASSYMVYHMLINSFNMGYKKFSFGRSTKNSNQARTKKHFGAKEIDIYTYNIELKSMDISLKVHQQKDFAIGVYLWKKLPLKMTEIFGKTVRKIFL